MHDEDISRDISNFLANRELAFVGIFDHDDEDNEDDENSEDENVENVENVEDVEDVENVEDVEDGEDGEDGEDDEDVNNVNSEYDVYANKDKDENLKNRFEENEEHDLIRHICDGCEDPVLYFDSWYHHPYKNYDFCNICYEKNTTDIFDDCESFCQGDGKIICFICDKEITSEYYPLSNHCLCSKCYNKDTNVNYKEITNDLTFLPTEIVEIIESYLPVKDYIKNSIKDSCMCINNKKLDEYFFIGSYFRGCLVFSIIKPSETVSVNNLLNIFDDVLDKKINSMFILCEIKYSFILSSIYDWRIFSKKIKVKNIISEFIINTNVQSKDFTKIGIITAGIICIIFNKLSNFIEEYKLFIQKNQDKNKDDFLKYIIFKFYHYEDPLTLYKI